MVPVHAPRNIREYYAGHWYNELRERRRGGWRGPGEAKKLQERESEGGEEGRQTILAKDRRYSNAFVVAAAVASARRNIFADYHGCGTTVIFFSSSVGARLFLPPPPRRLLAVLPRTLRPVRSSPARKRAAFPRKKEHPQPLFAYITELYYSLSGNIATR